MDAGILVSLALVLPFLGAIFVPLIAKTGKNAREYLAVAVGFLTAATTLLLLPMIWLNRTEALTYAFSWVPSIGLSFSVYVDPLAIMMAAIAGTIGSLVLLYSTKYMQKSTGLSRYYSLVLLFIGSMIGLVFVDNLLVLYFFWELVGLCSYALIGFYTTDPKAASAGIKALVITRVGDAAFLIGIVLLASGAASALGVDFWQALSIQYLLKNIASIPAGILAIAGFCFMLGAMGKSAQVPLHVWLPDAMEAPTTISALIHAATMVNAGVYLMARSLPLFASVPGWTDTLMWVGGITAILAATMAVVEPDLKRVLAYSTVSQLGFMMFGLGLGFLGFLPATFHLMSHAVFKALLFLGAGAVIHEVGTRNMYEMGGLRNEMKLTYATMLIGGLSLAGLVGFSGFWSKDMILETALETKNYIPLFVLAATAVLTAAYTFRMLNLVFFEKSRRTKKVHEAPWQMTVPLIILAAGSLVSWMSIGFLTRAYESFGFPEVHAIALVNFVMETLAAQAVLISVAAFLLGIGLFYARRSFARNAIMAKMIAVARKGYGFDMLYDEAIMLLKRFSVEFQKTHTGDLNYNTAGIAVGIIMLIALFLNLGGGI